MNSSARASVDTRTMVEALVNRNPTPDLVATSPDAVPVHRTPIFDKNFDWPENDRVWKAISELVEHAEDAWPELVKHLDDQRYCMTLEAGSGYTYNWTVSDICREIIGRTLAEAYYQNLRPLTKAIRAQMTWPDVARDKKQLKSWCEARSKKKLYELQIEMCKWAITKLSKPENFIRGVSHLRLKAWVSSIEADIESLGQSETAISFNGFGPEEAVPYSREKADKAFKRYEEIRKEQKGLKQVP